MKDKKYCAKAKTPELYDMLKRVEERSGCRWNGTGFRPAVNTPYPNGLNPEANYVAVDGKGWLFYFKYVDKTMELVDADAFVARCAEIKPRG